MCNLDPGKTKKEEKKPQWRAYNIRTFPPADTVRTSAQLDGRCSFLLVLVGHLWPLVGAVRLSYVGDRDGLHYIYRYLYTEETNTEMRLEKKNKQ